MGFENLDYIKIKTYNYNIFVEKDFDYFIFNKIKVIKKNGIFITGIHKDIKLNLLKKKEYLGQYGKILKINKCFNKAEHKKYYSVFIVFEEKWSCILAILCINNYMFYEKKLNASYSTIKPCKYYIIDKNCKIKNCIYYHGKINKKNSILKINNLNNSKIIILFNKIMKEDFKRKNYLHKLDNFIIKKGLLTQFPSVNWLIQNIKNNIIKI